MKALFLVVFGAVLVGNPVVAIGILLIAFGALEASNR